jgi:hypothetical protein
MIDDVLRSMGNAHIVFERDYLGDLGVDGSTPMLL